MKLIYQEEIYLSRAYPPIPTRDFDWCLSIADLEAESPQFHGRFPEAAIESFFDWYLDELPPRFEPNWWLIVASYVMGGSPSNPDVHYMHHVEAEGNLSQIIGQAHEVAPQLHRPYLRTDLRAIKRIS